jgi:hypothetical protein
MKKLIGHLRANTIAYLALFVALGGTSYAAVSIPAGSVGTKQLRNGAVTSKKLAKGSVTPAKLNSRSIAGAVVFWARIDNAGGLLASSRPATTSGWPSGTGAITFHGRLPANCIPLVSVGANAPIAGYAGVQSVSASATTRLQVEMRNASGQLSPLPVNVVEICP